MVGFSYLRANFSQSTAAVSLPRISRGFLTVDLEKVDIRVEKLILDRKIEKKSSQAAGSRKNSKKLREKVDKTSKLCRNSRKFDRIRLQRSVEQRRAAKAPYKSGLSDGGSKFCSIECRAACSVEKSSKLSRNFTES